ncbi:MAG: ATP-binding protein [Campylobacterota bacterium]|nr:ATP-binding protein [Campylobacterota bacterium]
MKIPKIIYLLLIFLTVQVLAMFIIKLNQQSKIDTLLEIESKTMKIHYDSIYTDFQKLSNTVFNGYINKPEVIELFKDKNRQELYDELKPSYDYLLSVSFKQIHFHTKENISFLRMHRPSKYGDDLTKYRYSVKYANINKQFISGLEMGRIMPGFRFVYPLFDSNNNHLGTVESSFAVEAFSKKLKKLYNVRTSFIIDKSITKKELFKSELNSYIKSIESDNYLILKSSIDEKILKNLDKLKLQFSNELKDIVEDNIKTKKVFTIDTYINKNYKLITFLPIKDIQKNNIGYFVIYRDSQQLKEYTEQIIYKYIISFLFFTGLMFFLYRELNNKEFLKKEIASKTKKLQDTAVQLEEQTTQLETLNNSLEEKIKIEVQKNAKQERELFQQSKQAALGDMIGNIAHQWRQPLSAISTSASGMQLTHMAGILNDDDFMNYTDAIVNNAKYLSQTIDDFRDFIKSDKKITRFDTKLAIEKCLAIVNSSINNHNLTLTTNLEKDIFVNNYENELQQSIINIFSNAKDILKEKVEDSEDRIVLIESRKNGKKINIVIIDSGGGIDENIIDKIFEPYFTTKHQSQGTGLGLYMTQQIVVGSMNGSIYVENETFEYFEKTYKGAKFTIELDLV